MTDTTKARDGQRRARTGTVVGVLVAAIASVALIRWISGHDRSPGWSGLVLALVTAAVIAVVLVATASWHDRRAWLGGVGLVLVAAGLGIGRRQTEVWEGSGGGDVISRLDTLWPLVSLGIAVSVAALLWSLRGPRETRSRALLATGSLLAVAAGYLAATVLMRDLVVGQWISGRPVRRSKRCLRATASMRRTSDGVNVGDLWLEAAADEAAAITAFLQLAERLSRAGAPEVLVERCQKAARDEARHVRVCERLAASAWALPIAADDAGAEIWRMPVPAGRPIGHPAEVVRLAVESFVDGVVGEGFAACRLETGSTTVSGDHAGVLRSMAREERRHATLGADIVLWALDAYPSLVSGGLRNAAQRLPASVELSAMHTQFSPSELQQVGFVDGEQARDLWSVHARQAIRWLGEVRGARSVANDRDRRRIAS